MTVRGTSVRIPEDLKRAVGEAVREQTVQNFTEAVNAALEEWLGREKCATCAAARLRAGETEEALGAARAEVAALKAEVAALRGVAVLGVRVARAVGAAVPAPAGADRDELLAALLEAATPESPVSKKRLLTVTGMAHGPLEGRLGYLARNGYAAKPERGSYYGLPGADIRKGIAEYLNHVAADTRDRRRAARAAAAGAGEAEAPSLPPASRRPAADRTVPPRVKNAAAGKNGSTPGAAPRPPVAASPDRAAEVAEAAREAGHDVRTASELAAVPVGAAMFQAPGEEKVIRGLAPEVPDHSGKKGRPAPATVAAACPPHPRKRVIKGFCYACGRQVPDDERIK